MATFLFFKRCIKKYYLYNTISYYIILLFGADIEVPYVFLAYTHTDMALTTKEVHKRMRSVRRQVGDVQRRLLEQQRYGSSGAYLFKYIGLQEEEDEGAGASASEGEKEMNVLSTKVLAAFDVLEYFCFRKKKRVVMEPSAEVVVLLTFNYKTAGGTTWVCKMQTLVFTPNGFVDHSTPGKGIEKNICIQELSQFHTTKTFITNNVSVVDMLSSLIVFLTSRTRENIHIGRYLLCMTSTFEHPGPHSLFFFFSSFPGTVGTSNRQSSRNGVGPTTSKYLCSRGCSRRSWGRGVGRTVTRTDS